MVWKFWYAAPKKITKFDRRRRVWITLHDKYGAYLGISKMVVIISKDIVFARFRQV